MTGTKTPRKALPRGLKLASGGHDSYEDGMCFMEAAAYLAGYGKITDHPECVSPVIGAFGRVWNDNLPDDDRQMLRPYAKRVLNTATGSEDDATRAWMATDWLVREFAPAWLRLAGLTEHAEALENLAPVLSDAAAKLAQPLIDAAESAARSAAESAAWSAAESAVWSAAESAAWSAAESAVWSAAESAARSAAESAAWSAAESAAWSAARSAAESAARSAARSAAWSAAEEALAPTVKILQKSALGLLDRMIAVGQEKKAA